MSSCVFVIASDVEDMFEKRIVNVAEPTLSSDAATKNYVDSAISGFSPAGKATDDYLQLLKPFNDNKLFISISFHTSFEMNSTLFNIDMNDPTELKYFRCLLNEGASQQWVAPDYQGLGPLYDNQPVCVLVKKYAEDNDIDMSEVMCASYYWYYRDTDGAIHKSDIYSSIFPCTSEIGCGMI